LSSTRAHGTVRCAVSALGLPGVRAPAPGPTAVAPAAGGPPASRSSSRTRGVRTRGRSTGMSCRLSGRSRWQLLTPTCSTRSMPSCGTAVTIATASGTCGSPDSVGARVQRAAGRIPAWGSRHRRSGRSHFILSGALRRAVRWLDLGESDRPGGPAGHAKVESWPPTPAQAARIIITARGWTGLGARCGYDGQRSASRGAVLEQVFASGHPAGCARSTLRPPPDRPGRRRALALAWPRAPVAGGTPPRSPICAADQRADGISVATVASRPDPRVEVSVAPRGRASSAAHDVAPPGAPPAGTGGVHQRQHDLKRLQRLMPEVSGLSRRARVVGANDCCVGFGAACRGERRMSSSSM
jgi:hypothetical protein